MCYRSEWKFASQDSSVIFSFRFLNSFLLFLPREFNLFTTREFLCSVLHLITTDDTGSPNLHFFLQVTITVLNVNDNPPQFQQGASRINLNIDNVYTNMTVHKFYAFDRDNEEGDGNLYFDIPRGNQLFAFKIDRDKGRWSICSLFGRRVQGFR